MSEATEPALPPPGDDVRLVRVGEREFALIGTAHVSQESVDLVERTIRESRPDRVCVELDAQRYDALRHHAQWDDLDLRQVIRRKQLATLLANLVLAAYQRRVGARLGVVPGTELVAATRVAEECGIPFDLCDRPIRVTLLRAWRSMSLLQRSKLVALVVAGMSAQDGLSEQDLRQLRRSDVLNELMQALAAELPALKRVLIDERDRYLAERIRTAEGRRIVAVVGAGHLEGIALALELGGSADLAALETLPRPGRALHWIGWGVPALILGSLAVIGWTHGIEFARDRLWYWVLATGIPCGIGAALAWAHPLTILTAVIAAPITTLHPLLGAGYVTAFVQAYVRPPLVRDFQTVTQDAGSLGRWWKNRLLRVLLAFVFPTIGAMIGMYIGSYGILSSFF